MAAEDLIWRAAQAVLYKGFLFLSFQVSLDRALPAQPQLKNKKPFGIFKRSLIKCYL